MIIVDNVTTPPNVAYLENLMLDQPWFYLRNTAYNQFASDMKPYDPSWVTMIYNYDEIVNPIMMSAFQSVLIKVLYEQKLSMSKLIRVRAGLTTRTPYPITHDPHVDWDNEHMTGLYYLNDSDGDTIIYNEKRDQTLTETSYQWSKNKNFTVQKSITPKADRFVIFDGATYHSSTSPTTTDYRIVINYNWLP